jgi:hypothetical protein
MGAISTMEMAKKTAVAPRRSATIRPIGPTVPLILVSDTCMTTVPNYAFRGQGLNPQ